MWAHNIRAHVHVSMHVRVHVCVLAHVDAHIYICVHVCGHVYTCSYVNMCDCVYICAYVCLHIKKEKRKRDEILLADFTNRYRMGTI